MTFNVRNILVFFGQVCIWSFRKIIQVACLRVNAFLSPITIDLVQCSCTFMYFVSFAFFFVLI